MKAYLSAIFLSLFLSVPFSYADYKQAVADYSQGRYEKAIQELKPDLERNPDWEFGHRLLGLCYLGLNNNALAANSLKRAVELKSPAFSAYYGLGQAYFNMKKYNECIDALNKGEALAAKERDPERERAKLNRLRGTAYYRMNRYQDAVSSLTNAMRSSQSDWTDYSMLGISYHNLGRTTEAVETLEKALSMMPGQKDIADILSKIYLKRGIDELAARRYQPALQALMKARDYDPGNGYIYYNMAEAYLFEKKYADAEKALNKTAELMPRNLDVYTRMGLVYEKQKKWDLALGAYRKANEISPSKAIKEAIERVTENRKLQ
ncbi:MAG: tetratricopeptide repeat protein [Acidobacteria bacterium]|nr:tetratricopeptide repeat protein [Acidobacteriota bacterium]